MGRDVCFNLDASRINHKNGKETRKWHERYLLRMCEGPVARPVAIIMFKIPGSKKQN